MLTVRSVDLLKASIGQNRQDHHTKRYIANNLIIRRGQTFNICINFSRAFDRKTDKLHLELKLACVKLPNDSQVIVPLVETLEDKCWQAKIVEQKNNRVKLSVNSPPTAPIGRYQLTVVIQNPKGEANSTYDPKDDIYMLFNPWCEDDAVYMDDEEEKAEYVLNDVGRLYYGTADQIGCRTWNFGQFAQGILEACFYVLDKSNISTVDRSDPVSVVRKMSAMINSNDENGILEGNWSNDYSGGTSPTAWSGSVAILKKYHTSNGKSVKFGQCWVFSGVTTTVLRCFGIPTRSVTNFSSAHDTDVSMTVDVYFDENMQPIDELNTDSIWNFHVWNDCWMARPDLPSGMGGWQAVDSTPQESSDSVVRCGPAPVNAVLTGQVNLKYDTPFVFAEISSDKIYWQKKPNGKFHKINLEKNQLGKCLITKAVGSDKSNDITHLYKYSDESEERRIAVETACSYGTKAVVYRQPTTKDVSVEITMEGDGPHMGEDAKLTIVLRNNSSEQRSTNLETQVAVTYYTGVLKGVVKRESFPVMLMPNEVKSLDWNLKYEDYRNKLVHHAALLLTLMGQINETHQIVVTQFNFRLRTPDLKIVPVGDAVVGKGMSAKITFTNPLPLTLKNVIFHVEGLGLQNFHQIVTGDVGSHATVTLTENFVPSLPGPRKLLASLHCPQLTQVHGVVDIIVQES